MSVDVSDTLSFILEDVEGDSENGIFQQIDEEESAREKTYKLKKKLRKKYNLSKKEKGQKKFARNNEERV